jgi:hypothetical protein
MKTLIIATLLALLSTQNDNSVKNIRDIVTRKQSLSKSKLISIGIKSIENFDNQFFPMGCYYECENLISCSFHGIRNDTLFDLALIFDNYKLISYFLQAESVFTRNVKGNISREIALGDILTKMKCDTRNRCVEVVLVKFDPIEYSKVGGKFDYVLGKNKIYENHLVCGDTKYTKTPKLRWVCMSREFY